MDEIETSVLEELHRDEALEVDMRPGSSQGLRAPTRSSSSLSHSDLKCFGRSRIVTRKDPDFAVDNFLTIAFHRHLDSLAQGKQGAAENVQHRRFMLTFDGLARPFLAAI